MQTFVNAVDTAAIAQIVPNPASFAESKNGTPSPSAKKSFDGMIEEARNAAKNQEKPERLDEVHSDSPEQKADGQVKIDSEKRAAQEPKAHKSKTASIPAKNEALPVSHTTETVRAAKKAVRTQKKEQKGTEEAHVPYENIALLVDAAHQHELVQKSAEKKIAAALVQHEDAEGSARVDEKKRATDTPSIPSGAETVFAFVKEGKNTNTASDEKGIKKRPIEKKAHTTAEPKITVTDLRTHTAGREEITQKKAIDAKNGAAEIRYDGKSTAEMTLAVSDGVQQNLTSANTQTAASSGSNFQAMLTNQLQNNAADFVRAGNILLKDHDSGQIKLILHPESLGNVKIDLQISDKLITGRITVASQEALNAFKESAESIRQAFVNSGFESAAFDVSMAGQGGFAGESGAQNQDDAGRRLLRGIAYGADSGGADLEAVGDFAFSAANSINIVA